MPKQTLIPGASELHFNHSRGPVTLVGGLAILACALPRAITAEQWMDKSARFALPAPAFCQSTPDNRLASLVKEPLTKLLLAPSGLATWLTA